MVPKLDYFSLSPPGPTHNGWRDTELDQAEEDHSVNIDRYLYRQWASGQLGAAAYSASVLAQQEAVSTAQCKDSLLPLVQ